MKNVALAFLALLISGMASGASNGLEVALAAIQGLNQKLEANLEDTRGELVKVRAEKQAEIDLLKKQFAERFASLEQRLLAMETPMH